MNAQACLAAGALCFAASLTAQSTGSDWPSYGGRESAWRYSGLDQIDRKNVNRMTPAWTFQTGVTDGGFQATPIVADGVMYVSTSWNRVYAINAETGEELWRYLYKNPRESSVSYSPWNRGVAVGNGRVFMGTLDNHVVALDSKNGRELWNVGVEDSRQCGCNITGAPLLVGNKVIAGVTGGDSAHRGYLTAFDAATGHLVWRFRTIPGPGEPGHGTWKGESWKLGGGATWMTGSYDPQLNLIYWGVGNAAADFYGADRSGDNLYTDSIVALEADTGKLKWYYQEVPHDVWDFDAAYECVLLDLPVKGKPRKLLLNVNKGGIAFLLDRVTGEFISAWPIVRNMNWIKGVDEQGHLIGRNEPEVDSPKLLCPSVGGGRSWNQGAFSPRTGWFYTTGIEWCDTITAHRDNASEGAAFFGGTFQIKAPPDGKAGGHLDAFDPASGKRFWSYESKYPLLASVLATAGDLVFTGDPSGEFFALDGLTGKKLWSFQTGSGHRGSSIAYSVHGREFAATPSGWGSAISGVMPQLWPETESFRGGCALFVFALPEKANDR